MDPISKQILVIGAGGKIGSALRRYWPDAFYFSSSSRNIEADLICDIRERRSLKEILEFCIDRSVRSVMILTGQSDPRVCRLNQEQSFLLNAELPAQLVGQLSRNDIHSVLVSSEYVYGSRNGFFSEEDAAPEDVYGCHKLALERLTDGVLRVVFRLPKVIWLSRSVESLFSRAVKDLVEQRSIRVAADQTFTPLLGDDLVRLTLLASQQRLCGVFNTGQDSCISRYEFYQKVADYLAVEARVAAVEAASMNEFDTAVPSAVCLNSNKIKEALVFSFNDVFLALKKRAVDNRGSDA